MLKYSTNYQSKILIVDLPKELKLYSQYFIGIDREDIAFWVQDLKGRHLSIEDFTDNKPVEELKKFSLAPKLLALRILSQRLFLNNNPKD